MKLTSSSSAKIECPNLPTYQHEIRLFHINVVDSVLKVSKRPDDKEKEVLNRVHTLEEKDERLDRVPKGLLHMDRQLRPALEKVCRKNIELKDDLEGKKLLLNEKGRHLAARRILITEDHLCAPRGEQQHA